MHSSKRHSWTKCSRREDCRPNHPWLTVVKSSRQPELVLQRPINSRAVCLWFKTRPNSSTWAALGSCRTLVCTKSQTQALCRPLSQATTLQTAKEFPITRAWKINSCTKRIWLSRQNSNFWTTSNKWLQNRRQLAINSSRTCPSTFRCSSNK